MENVQSDSPEREPRRCGHPQEVDCECNGNDQPADDTVIAPAYDTSVVHYDRGGSTTACGVNFARLGHDSYSAEPEVVDCPACRKLLPVIHHDPDRRDQLASCGFDLDRQGPDGWTVFPAAVTCPACRDVLDRADSPLARLSEIEAEAEGWTTTPAGHLVPADLDDDPRLWTGEPMPELAADETIVAPPEGFADLAPPIGPVPAPTEHRTVGLEVLTDELRAVADKAITAEFAKYDREPELLPPESRVVSVLRYDGRWPEVTDVDTDTAYRGADALAYLMHQAQGRAINADAELLMPGHDVIAALGGKPFGGYTAAVETRWGKVEPGWYVLVETSVDGVQDFVWLLVEGRDDCHRPDCVVRAGQAPWACAVVTIRGRGVQHLDAFNPVAVRIPADTAVQR